LSELLTIKIRTKTDSPSGSRIYKSNFQGFDGTQSTALRSSSPSVDHQNAFPANHLSNTGIRDRCKKEGIHPETLKKVYYVLRRCLRQPYANGGIDAKEVSSGSVLVVIGERESESEFVEFIKGAILDQFLEERRDQIAYLGIVHFSIVSFCFFSLLTLSH